MISEFVTALKEGNEYLSKIKPHLQGSQWVEFFTHQLTPTPEAATYENLISKIYRDGEKLFSPPNLQIYREKRIRQINLQLQKLIQTFNDHPHFPLGHVLLSHLTPFGQLITWEWLTLLLAQGNHVFYMCFNLDEKRSWEDWRSQLPFPEAFHPILYSQECWNLLAQHPSIKNYLLFAPAWIDYSHRLPLPDMVQKLKNVRVFFWHKSYALITKECDLDRATQELIDLILEGRGMMPWNVSRIFVEQSIEKEFKKSLQSALKNRSYLPLPDLSSATQGYFEETLQLVEKSHFLKTQGQVFFENPMITILEQVSFCDETHGRPFRSPLATLQDIKIGADINKWIHANPDLWGLFHLGSPNAKMPKYLWGAPLPTFVGASSWDRIFDSPVGWPLMIPMSPTTLLFE